MTTDEFIRCFLINVLPSGFHRIRHTGFQEGKLCAFDWATLSHLYCSLKYCFSAQ